MNRPLRAIGWGVRPHGPAAGVAVILVGALGVGTLGVGSFGCSADSPRPPSAGSGAAAEASASALIEPATPSSQPTWTLPERPSRTRAGQLRFADEQLHDNPAAAQLILDRLGVEPDADVRVALVEALPRTGGRWLDAVAGHFAREPDPRARAAIVAIAPRAVAVMPRADTIVSLLRVARVDSDERVRTEAAYAMGVLGPQVAQDFELAGELESMLGDAEAGPRAAAARSLGILSWTASFELIRGRLDDADGSVRLQALHALERLAGERTARLPELARLAGDGDPRVARLAARLRVVAQP